MPFGYFSFTEKKSTQKKATHSAQLSCASPLFPFGRPTAHPCAAGDLHDPSCNPTGAWSKRYDARTR